MIIPSDVEKKRPHHHGNLRETLILAGIGIVERDGIEALTLRKCAQKAGVSHAAPAHHFNGIISLKYAIIARGHQIFAQTMRALRDRAAPAAYPQLLAICEAYIHFAQTRSALFKFMFQPHDIDMAQLDQTTQIEITKESLASYQVLEDAVAPFGVDSPGQDATFDIEIAVWSLVHGYALLFADKTATPPTMKMCDPPDIARVLAHLNLNKSL